MKNLRKVPEIHKKKSLKIKRNFFLSKIGLTNPVKEGVLFVQSCSQG